MYRTIVRSKVDADGVLHLDVTLGAVEANREVQITIEPATPPGTQPMTQKEWEEFIRRTAGAITDPTFRRHAQGEYEQREAFP
jgi:hypothetical protein